MIWGGGGNGIMGSGDMSPLLAERLTDRND